MPELSYYRHHESHSVHGFTRPLPEDIEQQVRRGFLIPCDAPDPRTVQGIILTPEQEAALAGPEIKESKKEKRARLRAQLAALGDEDGDEDGDPMSVVVPAEASVAGEEAAGATTTTRGRRAAAVR